MTLTILVIASIWILGSAAILVFACMASSRMSHALDDQADYPIGAASLGDAQEAEFSASTITLSQTWEEPASLADR